MASKKPYGPQYRDAVTDLAILRGAKHSKLNVLRALLRHCNATTGQAFPGNKKIMQFAGITSKETLNNALRWLEVNGIIERFAYPNGGHERAVVWVFGLPAWSTPKTLQAFLETSLENGEDEGAKNLPKKSQEPPQKIERTSPIFGEPTRRTGKEKGGGGRHKNLPQNSVEEMLFDEWLRDGAGWTVAVNRLAEYRRQAA